MAAEIPFRADRRNRSGRSGGGIRNAYVIAQNIFRYVPQAAAQLDLSTWTFCQEFGRGGRPKPVRVTIGHAGASCSTDTLTKPRAR
jgi:hypothetical protein